jgi:hypothetical protein
VHQQIELARRLAVVDEPEPAHSSPNTSRSSGLADGLDHRIGQRDVHGPYAFAKS